MRSFFLLAVVCVLAVPASASEFDTLLKRIPRGANTILAIDSDRVLASDMAKTNGWGSRVNDGSRPVYLPSEADKVIVAAQIDPVRRSRDFEVAIMGMKEALSMRLVAKAEGGYAEEINGQPAAWVPSNAYFVQLDANTMGMRYPANRQEVSRWVARKSGDDVSQYLRVALSGVKAGPQIVLALDTQDLSQAHRIHQSLSESDVTQKFNLKVDQLVPVFASMKGLKLGITLTDKAEAQLQVDFGQEVSFNARVAKAFLLSGMSKFGVEVPGVDGWKATVSGRSIMMNGTLDQEALRRVLSLLEIPTTKFSSLRGEETKSAGSTDDVAKKSLAYFRSVTQLTDSLKKKTKSAAGDSYWVDRYAQKIDRLPILHVDPELLDFGQNVAQTLRVISGSRKAANLRSGVAASNIGASGGGGGSSYGYRSGGYGSYGQGYQGSGYAAPGVSAKANLNQGVAAASAAKRGFEANATARKIEGYRLIDNAASEMRRKMTEKYSLSF